MHLTRRDLVRTGTFALFCQFPFGAWSAQDPLKAVYDRMDRSALNFKCMTARVQKTAYTAVIDESNIENGKILVLKAKPHDVRIRLDVEPPDEKQVAVDSNKVEIYYPKTNSSNQLFIGKQNKPMVEQLLLLGFGSTSQDLLSVYNIKYIGPETVAGVHADRIELTPKDKELLQHFRKIELWISPSGLAVQQKFSEPGRNYNLAVFTNIDLQSRVTEADVKLKIPKDASKAAPIGKRH